MKKFYKFVGPGDGVGGLRHAFPEALGQRMIKEYEAIKKREDKNEAEIKKQQRKKGFTGKYIRPYLDGMSGKILLDCMDQGIYILVEAESEADALAMKIVRGGELEDDLLLEEEKTPEIFFSVAAGKLAEEEGLDLTKIPGTGKDGSITVLDVRKHLKANPKGVEEEMPQPPAEGEQESPSDDAEALPPVEEGKE